MIRRYCTLVVWMSMLLLLIATLKIWKGDLVFQQVWVKDNRIDQNGQFAASTTPPYRICSQDQRKALLQEMCDVYKQSNKTIHRDSPHLIVDERHKIAYCFIEKAGCSSWKTILANISSQGEVKPNMNPAELRMLHASIHKYGLTTMKYDKKTMGDYKKFLVVRHPMERLLSAYRDKMQGGDVMFNTQAFTVVKDFRTNKSNPDKFPTFQEFISMLLSKKQMSLDPHWNKYFYKCDPCMVDYNYLLKLETMEHDMNMLLSELYQDDMKYVSDKRLNAFSEKNHQIHTFKHHLAKFEELTVAQIAQLTRLFEHESDMFGYQLQVDGLESDCCTKTPRVDSQTHCCC